MSFKVYKGVVESRADPLQLGRCKVRVVGVHTAATALLPTKDLPWAYPMQPIISAGVSGVGYSPTGVVESTWVWVFFSDGENKQQPVMMGVIAGIPESVSQGLDDTHKSTNGTDYENVSDNTNGSNGSGSGSGSSSSGSGSNGGSGSGSSGNNGSGDQVLTQGENNNSSQNANDGSYKLGQVSKKYESGNAGAGTVSSGKGDYGGVSYGTHQLASFRDNTGASKGSASSNSPVQQFVNSSKWSSEFKGMTPGTTEYSNKWKEVAKRDSSEFESAQYEYFKGQYYNKGSNNIKSAGIDLSNRGNAVQEAIWSTSIQYGPGGARKVFVRALDGKDIGSMSDAEIVAAVQDDKLKNVDTDFKSSSESVKNGIRNRIKGEKADLIALAGNDGKDNKKPASESGEGTEETSGEEGSGNSGDYTEDSEYKPPANNTPTSGVKVPTTPDSNTTDGFQDPSSRYPKQAWLNEPDVSRLARHKKIQQTIMETKRNSLVKNVQSSPTVQWDEPESPYDAIYPLNHVHQTESGHVVEYDDTPNKERIHFYHRMGAFIEFHPNGTVVYKSTKDQFEITVANRNIYVGGNCNITVAGDSNIYTKGVARMESDGDMFIKTKSNLRIGAEGTAHIESNGQMYVGSTANTNVAGALILLNCSYSAGHVNAGGYNAGEIAVEVMHDSTAPVPTNLEGEVIQDLKNDGTITPDSGGSSGSGGTATQPTTPDKEGEGDAGSSTDPEPNKEETPVCEGCCDFKEEDLKPSLQLSKNFKLADLTTSAHYPHTLKAQGGKSKLEIAKSLCALANNVLEPIVSKYGRNSFIITSGFRAGSGTSQHLKGEAVDIQFVGINPKDCPARATEVSGILKYDQMILEYHGNAPVFHISYNNGGRGQKLSTPNLKNYFSGFRYKDMTLPK